MWLFSHQLCICVLKYTWENLVEFRNVMSSLLSFLYVKQALINYRWSLYIIWYKTQLFQYNFTHKAKTTEWNMCIYLDIVFGLLNIDKMRENCSPLCSGIFSKKYSYPCAKAAIKNVNSYRGGRPDCLKWKYYRKWLSQKSNYFKDDLNSEVLLVMFCCLSLILENYSVWMCVPDTKKHCSTCSTWTFEKHLCAANNSV